MAISQRSAITTLAIVALAGVVAVVVLLVARGPSERALPPDPWAVAGPLEVAEVAVTPCPTSFGAPGTRDVALPPTLRVEVSASLRAKVTVFTDGLGLLDVLAPSSWGCTALDAVDGSSTLVVFPPGAPLPRWGSVNSVRDGIVASQTGACVGCSLQTACPLFSGARASYVATYGLRCHLAPAHQEVVARISPSHVLFIDPPGVLGAGRPSGGGLAAYGAMLWHLPHTRLPTAWLDTCTLPTSYHDLCVLSVRAFVARRPA